jgi:hypothetical protein
MVFWWATNQIMKKLKDIIEGLKINSKTKLHNDYRDYGEGEMDNLNIDHSLCELFNINLSDNELISFTVEIYDMMKKYKIPVNDKFYHIKDKDLNKKFYTYIRPSNCDETKVLTIKKDTQIHIYKTPDFFIIGFIGYKNNKLINDYFLHIV